MRNGEKIETTAGYIKFISRELKRLIEDEEKNRTVWRWDVQERIRGERGKIIS